MPFDRQPESRTMLGTLLCVCALALSACADFKGIAPQATLRDSASLDLTAGADAAVTVDAQWWHEFGDAQLDSLVGQALAESPSLRIAQARLARAQAAASAVGAVDGPQVGAGIDLTRQLFSANSLYPPPLGGAIVDTGTAQLSGRWELDFFGKNRAALDAALGTVRAVQVDAQAARTLLASSVVRSYFQLGRLQAQRTLAQRQLAQRGEVLQLVQERVQAGLDTRLELRQSEGTLPEARLQIEMLQEQITLAENALAALIGQPNKPVALEVPSLTAIKHIATATTIPADLLGRRPDIAAARWRVEAATQDAASAKSQFYPNVDLVAFAGFSSIGLNHLLATGGKQWGVGPALRLPVFDGGLLRARLRGKTAELDAAIESYNASVIDAVHEVADQLASTQAIARQQAEQRAAQDASERAYDIASRRYVAGLGNRLAVLAAETAVLNQRRQAIDLGARALDTQVALLRALGGGYQSDWLTSAHASNQ